MKQNQGGKEPTCRLAPRTRSFHRRSPRGRSSTVTAGRTVALVTSVVVATLLVSPLAGAPATVPTYTLRDTGFLPGFTSSFGAAINSQGDVVGSTSDLKTGIDHAFLYSHGGQLFDVGALLGPARSSYANGLNAQGEIVGQFNEPNGPQQGFLYRSGQLQTFNISGSASDFTWMTAINNLGQIVGNYSTDAVTSDRFHAFLRQPDGKIVLLPDIGGQALIPRAINDRGQIVGEVEASTTYLQHAILTQPRGLAPRDLGTLGVNAYPAALNNLGQAVGYSQVSVDENLEGPFSAVLYAGGKVIDLGTLPGGKSSFAVGINDLGQIVGDSDVRLSTGSLDQHGFIYLQGRMYDLNALLDTTSAKGLTVIDAAAINDAGQIVGTARDASGNTHTVILAPRYR